LFNDRSRQNKLRDETYKNATSASLKTAKVENSLNDKISFSVLLWFSEIRFDPNVPDLGDLQLLV
jgi:hypothetical protein